MCLGSMTVSAREETRISKEREVADAKGVVTSTKLVGVAQVVP